MFKKIFILTLVMYISSIGQVASSWKNYTDMKNLTDVCADQTGFWAASKGGAFHFNSTDSSFLKLTKSENLSGHDIESVCIDKNGYVWMGASSGVINVFNPTDESIYKILDIANSSKSVKSINDLQVLGDTIFAATDFGLSAINSSDYSFYETVLKFGELPTETKVNSVTIGNKLIVSTNGGIAILKEDAINLSAPESWISYQINIDINAANIYKTVYFKNEFYSGTDKGLFKFENSKWNKIAYSGNNIFDLEIVGDSLFILSNNKLYSYKNGISNLIYSETSSVFSQIDSRANEILIASTNGAKIITPVGNKSISPNGPNANTFNSIAIDRNSNIWVGSGKDPFGLGIYHFDGEKWENFDKSNSSEIKYNFFHTISFEDDGNLYASNWGGGFTRIDKNHNLHSFNAYNTGMIGINSDNNYVVVQGVHLDSKGNLWSLNMQTASRNNLMVLTPDSTWHYLKFTATSIGSEQDALYLAIDQYDTKWFTVDGRGLFYFNENSSIDNTSNDVQGVLTEANGLNSNNINAISVDKRGSVWIGTILGLNFITNPSQPKSGISSVFSLRQQTITSIGVDPLNRKWVGTTTGLSLISPDGTSLIETFTKENSPLPDNTIRSISVDEKTGIVYVGTDFGMSSFKTSAIKPVDSMNELFIYPSPFKIKSNSRNIVNIDGLANDSILKIFNMSGELVIEINTDGGRLGNWDGKDFNGNTVSSGIYIVTAFNQDSESVASAKIAVIRE